MIDFLVDKILLPGSVILATITLIALPLLIYQDCTAEKFCLVRKEWICSKSKTRLLPMYNPALKVTILTPMTTCVEYKENL